MKPHFILLAVFFLGTTLHAQVENQSDEESESEITLREPIPAKTDPIAAQLVETYFKAAGGKDRFKAINSLLIKETIREGKSDYKTVTYRERPDKLRVEVITERLGREFKVISGYDGEEAWAYDLTKEHPFPKELSGKDKKAFVEFSPFDDILLNWEEKGCVLEYMGAVNNRKQKNYLIKLYHPDGLTEFFYFHPKNYLITRQGKKEERNGLIVNVDNFFVKYDKIDGLWMPVKTELALESQVYGTSEITEIKLNPPVTDDLFTIPKVKEVWLRSGQ